MEWNLVEWNLRPSGENVCIYTQESLDLFVKPRKHKILLFLDNLIMENKSEFFTENLFDCSL